MWVIRMFGSEDPLFSSKRKASELVRDPIVELWEVGRFMKTLQVADTQTREGECFLSFAGPAHFLIAMVGGSLSNGKQQ